MTAVWSGQEQTAFQQVIAGFNQIYPHIKVNFTSGGNNLPQILSTAVAGGHPPDLAALPQPGLMKQFVASGALKPIDFAKSIVDANFSPTVVNIGTDNGHFYGLLFKAANKSTVWYNVPAFQERRHHAAHHLDAAPGRRQDAQGLGRDALLGRRRRGLADHRPVRERLSAHRRAWPCTTSSPTSRSRGPTPRSPRRCKDMAQIYGNSSYINGGNSGAATTDFPTSVTNVYTTPPKAAMVFEADFVESVITSSTKAKPTTGFDYFPFPSINGAGRQLRRGRR